MSKVNYQLMKNLQFKIYFPTVVMVDNVRWYHVKKSPQQIVKVQKHFDIWYKFINDYIEDGTVKIIFMKSKDNEMDIYTMNLNEDLETLNQVCANKLRWNSKWYDDKYSCFDAYHRSEMCLNQASNTPFLNTSLRHKIIWDSSKLLQIPVIIQVFCFEFLFSVWDLLSASCLQLSIPRIHASKYSSLKHWQI